MNKKKISPRIPSHNMSEIEKKIFAEKLQNATYPEQVKILYQHDFIIPG
jgi:hypothetical protein